MSYFIIFILFFLIQITRGTDANNYFITPSSDNDINPIWTLGDEQVISWATTLGIFNISFWQQSLVEESAASQGNIYSKIHSIDQVTNFTRVVQLYGFSLDYSNVFLFWINPDGPDGFVSCYFNITRPTATTTTSTIDATASSTSSKVLDLVSSTPSSTVTGAATYSPTTTSAASSAGMAELTTGKIALGVGVGVGVPVLAALGALVWLKARANNRNIPTAASSQENLHSPSWLRDPHQVLPKPKEMPGTNPMELYPELPGQQQR
ncbi:hypothetical protein BO71DRAFT_402236 [Aspergillus ellipticus CBS 707.79]|uniref:Mid2 domain-containing protein n=1 Tax=Aspergillus ellipticus CBS 707.79 TaxID=1448320 RepID=A0A319DH19_9EURO|nr:hypothetical protein BO71DRAFT_402236 [Aspergillus ellipticus CBS 707.79]